MRPDPRLSLTVGIALGAFAGAWLAFDSFISRSMTAFAEPAPEAKNTGSPAGGAFLMDLRRTVDPGMRYLSDYEMNEDWIKISYRPQNVRFDADGMTLELSKSRGKLPFSGAEFQRNGTYGYGRYEAVMRASEATGAVASFFTYTGAYFGDPHDEIDFEFVGRAPRFAYLNYFKNGESDQVAIPLWFDTAMADHLYAFEWTPDSIRWYVDGVKVREVDGKTARLKIPTTTGRVIANLWAGTGPATGWTGEAEFTHTTASYRCISHVPLGKTGPQCSDTFRPPPKP